MVEPTISMAEAADEIGWRYERVRQRCQSDHPDRIPSIEFPTRTGDRSPQVRRRIPVGPWREWKQAHGLE